MKLLPIQIIIPDMSRQVIHINLEMIAFIKKEGERYYLKIDGVTYPIVKESYNMILGFQG